MRRESTSKLFASICRRWQGRSGHPEGDEVHSADPRQIIAGHGRYEAALLLGLPQIFVVGLEHLSEAKARAYMLADNKLTDRSAWNDEALALHLRELTYLALDFEIEAIGFEPPEIDLRIQSLDTTPEDEADNFEVAAGPVVTKPGDLWHLDSHRLYCGSALDLAAHAVLADQKAAAVFTDPPYNVKINGHASGKGRIAHREFPMASGEMTEAEFTNFLQKVFGHLRASCHDGALIYTCMDRRHMGELLTGARDVGLELLNLCVWAKTNGGMGTLYRSRHELVFVLKNGPAPYLNNVQLGRFGRNRSNVWNYPGASSFSRKKGRPRLDLHPTAKRSRSSRTPSSTAPTVTTSCSMHLWAVGRRSSPRSAPAGDVSGSSSIRGRWIRRSSDGKADAKRTTATGKPSTKSPLSAGAANSRRLGSLTHLCAVANAPGSHFSTRPGRRPTQSWPTSCARF
jgi:hypothetical protein